MVLVAVQLSVSGLYLPPVLKLVAIATSHPTQSFHCLSRLPCDCSGHWARWWCWWLSKCRCRDHISRRCSEPETRYSRPRRSFHCLSRLPCECRALGALVVLVAVQLLVAGLYLPPVFNLAAESAPDDHFAAGPHCHLSRNRRVGGARGCPTIGSALSRGIGYCGKRVISVGHVASFGLHLRWQVFQRRADSAMAKSRSTSVGLARHSAIRKGSFPSATNSSRRTSGCFVSRAIRSISDCSCSAVIALCQ